MNNTNISNTIKNCNYCKSLNSVQYISLSFYNSGNLWDSVTCIDVAPNETENSSELHKELINKIKELNVKGF